MIANKIYIYQYLLVLCVLLPSFCQAAPLTLFNSGRKKTVIKSTSPVKKKPLGSVKVADNKQKKFILRGTQRIGSKYTAYLELAGGKNKGDMKVEWIPGKSTPIKGYSGYYLTYVTPRRATMRYPGTCLDDSPQNGIHCRDVNIAALTLVRRRPIAVPKSKAARRIKANYAAKTASRTAKTNVGSERTNPFKTLLARAKAQKALGKRKQGRRPINKAQVKKPVPLRSIKDGDVPAGMKIVHSPFGDMLRSIDK